MRRTSFLALFIVLAACCGVAPGVEPLRLLGKLGGSGGSCCGDCRVACCCPDDYCPKPCLLVPCPPKCCCPDNYCPKPCPPIPCPPACCCPDDYCPKPCPVLCWPKLPSYYTCGPAESCCTSARRTATTKPQEKPAVQSNGG